MLHMIWAKEICRHRLLRCVFYIKVSWVASTWSDEMLFFSDFPIRHSHFRIVLYLEQNTSTHTRHDASL